MDAVGKKMREIEAMLKDLETKLDFVNTEYDRMLEKGKKNKEKGGADAGSKNN